MKTNDDFVKLAQNSLEQVLNRVQWELTGNRPATIQIANLDEIISLVSMYYLDVYYRGYDDCLLWRDK